MSHITIEDSGYLFSWKPVTEGDEFSVYLSFPETNAGDQGATLLPTEAFLAFADMIRPHFDRIKSTRSYEIVK